MIRFLLAIVAFLVVGLALAMWRIDSVTGQRDISRKAAKQAEARASSLRETLSLQRQIATDQAAIETNYLKEKKDAEDKAERLRRCLADGTCGLRVAATCPVVRVDGAATSTGEPDGAAPELTAAARRAYPTLVAGLQQQRAQILDLQAELTMLHGNCKIGASK